MRLSSCGRLRAHDLAVGREMDAAFALAGRPALALPPPAAGARVLAGGDGPRAGRAADRAVALLVQRMEGHLALAEVVPNLFLAPVGERVKFAQAVRLVPFLDADRRAR